MGLALSAITKQVPSKSDGMVGITLRMPKPLMAEIKKQAEVRGWGLHETIRQLLSFGLVHEWDRQDNQVNRSQLAQMLRSQTSGLDASQLRLLVDVALNLER